MNHHHDTDGAECVVTLGHVPNVLPELADAERGLEHVHEDLRALHYNLCAHLVKHGHHRAADLALSDATRRTLRDLDGLRDELAACRRALAEAAAEREAMRAALHAVAAEVTPGRRPLSSDSWLPSEIVGQVLAALTALAEGGQP